MTDHSLDQRAEAAARDVLTAHAGRSIDRDVLAHVLASAVLAEVRRQPAARPATPTDTGHTGLRQRIADTVQPLLMDGLPAPIAARQAWEIAMAVLAVLPAAADRAAVYREAADDLEAWQPEFSERWAVADRQRYEDGIDAAADRLRRMTDETATTQTHAPCGRSNAMTSPCSAGDWCCQSSTARDAADAAAQPAGGEQ